MCGDSNVVEKWISGPYAVVDKLKERIGAPKTLHSLWKRKMLTRVENIGVYVRHISREHNHEAHYLANLGADRVKKVVVEQGGNNERWKAVK